MLKSFKEILEGKPFLDDKGVSDCLEAFEQYFAQKGIPQPLWNLFIIEPLSSESTMGDIIMPQNMNFKDRYGIVRAVGEDEKKIKVGDKVMYFEGSGEPIDFEVDNDIKTFLIIDRTDLKAVV